MEFENEEVIAFDDINPAAKTHIVIIPKKHVATFMDLEDGIENLVKAAQDIVKEKKIAQGYKIIVNGGKYQEVLHFHLHLLAGNLEKP